MRLTAHFDSSEFKCRDGTAAPPNYLAEITRVCRTYLEPLRDRFGPVTITSGFRTVTYNRVVGGAPQSYHLGIARRAGAAADVTCRRGTPADWFAFLDRLGAPGLGRYATFVHVDNRRGKSRW